MSRWGGIEGWALWPRVTAYPPCRPDARVDLRFADGSVVSDERAGDWRWGPELEKKLRIEAWRLTPSSNASPERPSSEAEQPERMISDADFEKLLEGPPDTKETNPKDAIGTTKLDFGLVPDTAVAAMAVGFTEGDAKYGGHNYRVAGVRASIYHAALRRHVAKWWNGEDTDPTTGVPHLWNALCCLAVLVDADECKKLTDDRPPRAPVADMIDGGAGYVQRLRELFPNGPRRYTHVEDDPE